MVNFFFLFHRQSHLFALVREGPLINTDVTAPGAMMALGLMYIRTNIDAVASLLDLPDTEVYMHTRLEKSKRVDITRERRSDNCLISLCINRPITM